MTTGMEQVDLLWPLLPLQDKTEVLFQIGLRKFKGKPYPTADELVLYLSYCRQTPEKQKQLEAAVLAMAHRKGLVVR